MSEEEFNKEKKFLINRSAMQQLVGEFKIAVQRVQENIRYTEQEYIDIMTYIKAWEDKIYD